MKHLFPVESSGWYAWLPQHGSLAPRHLSHRLTPEAKVQGVQIWWICGSQTSRKLLRGGPTRTTDSLLSWVFGKSLCPKVKHFLKLSFWRGGGPILAHHFYSDAHLNSPTWRWWIWTLQWRRRSLSWRWAFDAEVAPSWLTTVALKRQLFVEVQTSLP